MAFATYQDDLRVRWRTLDAEQQATAAVLLEDASRDLSRDFPDAVIDPDLLPDVKRIVCNMVRREMIRLLGDADVVESQTDTRGPFSTTRRYLGDMYITDREFEILTSKTAKETSGRVGPVWTGTEGAPTWPS